MSANRPFPRTRGAIRLLTAALLFGSGLVNAQPGGLGGVELFVVEAYKGRIAEASKISEQPNTVDTLVHTRPQTYSVASIPLQFELAPPPLKPLLVSKVNVPKLPNYHLDLGLGNNGFFTTHLSAGSGRSNKRQWGGEFAHRSTQSGVRDNPFDDQPTRNTRLQGHFKLFDRNSAWSGSAAYDRQAFSYYGFPEDTALFETAGSEAEKQNIHRIELDAAWTSLKPEPGKDRLDQARMGYRYLKDRFGNFENRLFWEAQSHFDLAGQGLELGGTVDFFRSDMDSIDARSRSFALFSLRPMLNDRWGDLRFGLGLDLGYELSTFNLSGTDRGGFYVLPNFRADYTLVPAYLSAFGDWTGRIDPLSLDELNRKFPFLHPSTDQETTRKTRFRLGVRGRITHRWSYEVSGHYSDARNEALLYRDPNFEGVRGAGFGLLFDRVSALGFEAGMNFQTSDLDLQAGLQYDNYDTDLFDAAYHLPSWKAHLTGGYRVHPKFRAELELEFEGVRTAYEEETQGILARDLDGYIDLGLGVTYLYNDALSARLRFDNVLFQEYYIAYGYAVVPFQASLVLSYRF